MRLPAIVVAVAIAIGAGIGAAVASLGHVHYQAEASVLVSAKGGAAAVAPLLPNMRQVATSSVLAGDVHSTLRLPGSAESLRKAIHATTPPHTQLIVVSYTSRNRMRAQQVAQEIAVKVTQLVPVRFAKSAQGLRAAVFDQAHVVSRSGPDFVGDSLIGGAIGLVLALSALAATLRRAPEAAPGRADGPLAEREARLQERIAAVSARESALARRMGELAQRERALEAGAVAPPVTVAPSVAAEPPPPFAEPEPEPVFELPPEPVPVAVDEGPAERTLTELERLVRANADRFPDSVDEWNAYLFYLRDYADASGRLPASFDSLIDEVFGALAQA